MNYEKIGSNIKTAMLNKNVTNEKLAKKMDISEKRLEDILEGREHPSLDTLILISMLLNVNINGLLDMDVSQTYLKTKLKQSIKMLWYNIVKESDKNERILWNNGS